MSKTNSTSAWSIKPGTENDEVVTYLVDAAQFSGASLERINADAKAILHSLPNQLITWQTDLIFATIARKSHIAVNWKVADAVAEANNTPFRKFEMELSDCDQWGDNMYRAMCAFLALELIKRS